MEPPNSISDGDKLDSAGALVTTFGTSGKFTFNTTTGHTEELRASGISSDTFLYVAGNDPSAGTYFLARVNLLIGPGTLDTTFNTGSSGFVSRGTITYSPACCAVSYTPSAYALAFQDDGMVVVAGTARGCSPSTMFAMRFKHQYTSGAITDPTFNSGAEKMIDFGAASGYNAAGLAVAITNTGKIYVAGDAGAIGCGTVAFAVSRLSSAGALDSTFDSDGLLTTTSFVGYASSQINAAAILSNGKFMAAGQVVAGGRTTSDFALSKYNAPAGLEERVYAQHDANFDVTAITDTFGTVIERYLYDSYGKRTIFSSAYGGRGSSSYSFDFGFQGGQYVANAELMVFRNRYLNTSIQRWMQVDPKGYPDGMNSYESETSSPNASLDPDGESRYVFAFEGLGGYDPIQSAGLRNGGRTLPYPSDPGKWAAPYVLSYLLDDVIGKMPDTKWEYYAHGDLQKAVSQITDIAKKPISGSSTGSSSNSFGQAPRANCQYNTIILLGFSMGGGAALDVANELKQAHIKVDLGFTIDPVPNDGDLFNIFSDNFWGFRKPANASTWDNYYQRLDTVIQGRSVSGADLDLDVGESLKSAYHKQDVAHSHRHGLIVEWIRDEGLLSDALYGVDTSRSSFQWP